VQISNVHNTWLIGAGIGYRFSENFRSDIAYSYRGGPEIMDHDGAGTAITTKIKSSALFLNGYFDFPTKWQKAKPYAGAGVGWANNQLSDTSYVNPFGANTLRGGTVNNFAWDVGLGLGFEVSKGMIIDIGYRYVDLGKAKLDSQTALGFAGYSASGQLRANELQLGFRF
jgi:opacity protein-like surface antigen